MISFLAFYSKNVVDLVSFFAQAAKCRIWTNTSLHLTITMLGKTVVYISVLMILSINSSTVYAQDVCGPMFIDVYNGLQSEFSLTGVTPLCPDHSNESIREIAQNPNRGEGWRRYHKFFWSFSDLLDDLSPGGDTDKDNQGSCKVGIQGRLALYMVLNKNKQPTQNRNKYSYPAQFCKGSSAVVGSIKYESTIEAQDVVKNCTGKVTMSTSVAGGAVAQESYTGPGQGCFYEKTDPKWLNNFSQSVAENVPYLSVPLTMNFESDKSVNINAAAVVSSEIASIQATGVRIPEKGKPNGKKLKRQDSYSGAVGYDQRQPTIDDRGFAEWGLGYFTSNDAEKVEQNEWYMQSVTDFILDLEWKGDYENPIWARWDDTAPLISEVQMLHSLSPSNYKYIPSMRRIYNYDVPGTVGFEGGIEIVWKGDKTTPVDAQFVMTKIKDVSRDLAILIDSTFHEPDDGYLYLPLDSMKIDVESLDEVLLTIRGLQSVSGRTISIVDTLLTWTFNSPEDQLPVELVDFTAIVDGKDVTLVWETASEINNAGFKIEQQIGDGRFHEIAFVSGSGTINTIKQYSYRVTELAPGNYTYRLRQVDFDGAFEYSNIVFVDIPTAQYNLSQTFPNPFNPSTKIQFAVPVTSQVLLEVFDSIGRKVKTLVNSEFPPGEHSVLFDGSSFPSGVYTYRITAGIYTETRFMTLIK